MTFPIEWLSCSAEAARPTTLLLHDEELSVAALVALAQAQLFEDRTALPNEREQLDESRFRRMARLGPAPGVVAAAAHEAGQHSGPARPAPFARRTVGVRATAVRP